MELKTQNNTNPIIVGDFNIPLFPIDRSSGQKISRKLKLLLACFPWLVQLVFLYNQGPPAQVVPPTEGWALPHQSLFKEMPPQIFSLNQLEAISQPIFPLLRYV